MKKILSLILALAVVMSMSVCAFATETTTVEAAGDDKTTAEGKVDLVGTVYEGAVLLSVVMPTTLTFQVGTEQSSAQLADKRENGSITTGGYIFASLISGEGTVTNNSTHAIDLYISKVEDTNGLTDKMNLGVTGNALDEATALSSYLTTATTDLKLSSNIATEGGTDTLKVVGSAAKGNVSGGSFDINLAAGDYTVTTTLKVAVAAQN